MVTQVHPEFLDPTMIGGDTSTYFAAGQRLNDGHPLYELSPGDRPVPLNPPFWSVPLLSPPLIAVVWRPLAALEDLGMLLWWVVVFLTMSAVTLWVISRGTPIRNTIMILTFPAIAYSAISGNVNAFIALLLVAVAFSASRGLWALAGGALAVAAAIKLLPLLLLAWFVTQRRWAAVRAFVIVSVALGLVTLIGGGLGNLIAYIDVMRSTASVGATPYSVPGWLANWGVSGPLVGFATVLVMTGGVIAIWLARRSPGRAWILGVITVLFGSPVVMLGNYSVLLAAFVPVAPAATNGSVAASTADLPLRSRKLPTASQRGVTPPSLLHRYLRHRTT